MSAAATGRSLEEKMRLFRAAPVIVVLALCATALVPAPANAQPTSACEPTERGYVCLYGPVNVPQGEMVELFDYVAPPPEAGFITGMRATLVDRSGRRIAHHMVHLHHAVWINPTKPDFTCEAFNVQGFDVDVDRFFATGKERTRLVMPEGYGYHWSNETAFPTLFDEPWWGLVAHLDGMHGSSQTYIRLNLDFVPEAEAAGMIDVKPVWLDVRNCSQNPVYDVPRRPAQRVHKERWSYTMPESGRFITMGGHLHDGGKRLVLRNRTTGSTIFTSKAIYGLRGDPWYLTQMTAMSGLPGVPVTAGDELMLTSVYDSTHRLRNPDWSWRDVMGIMVGYLAPPS
ncbi:MAG: hypothetical protein ACRDKT_04380 [Actinomycetota bacterium]